MARPAFRAVMAAWVTAFALVSAPRSDAAPAPGPLTGRELRTTRELQSGLESLAGSLLGSDVRGDFTRVTVTEDSPRRLVIAVRHRGFLGARLSGELMDSPRSRQAGIRGPEPVGLAGDDGEVELVFEPADGATPGRSRVLRLSVTAPQRSTPGFRRLYELGKDWTVPASAGSDFVVTVTPRPVGRTAELGPQPSVVVPSAGLVAPPVVPAPKPSPTRAPVTPTLLTRSLVTTDARPAPAATTRAIAPVPAAPTVAPNAAQRALSQSALIQSFQVAKFGLRPEDTDRGARGPAAVPVSPFAGVRTEDIGLDVARVFDFSPDVYPDQNPASGVFYFVPGAFGLAWNATDGYQFRTVYGAAEAAGAAGQVLMAARLDAGIGAAEVKLAAELVRAWAQANGRPFTELRALPVDSVRVSLAEALSTFDVRGDRVAVHGLTEVLGQLEVSWVTDERAALFVREALVENVGLGGSAHFHAVGGQLRERSVPVRLRLADEASFGTMTWDRLGWRNRTPFPVTLRWLHALRIAPGQPPVVHSWALGDTRVPPGGQVRWNSTAVPAWLDRESRKMWLDFSVDGSCAECGNDAIAAMTGGVSSTGSSEITFRTLTPLADTEAFEIVAEVRSRFWDPRGRTPQIKRVVLDADGKEFRLGPLFVDAGRAASGSEALFEYRLALTSRDGRTNEGEGRWIPARDLRVNVGSHQVQTSLGSLPAR